MLNLFAAETAFVGKEIKPGQYLVHLEEPGNASNVVTYEDRIRHAAGRLHESYPTSKMIGGNDDTFLRVGTVMHQDDLGWHIDEITDRTALEAWADGPHYEGGSPGLHEDARARRLSADYSKGKFA